MASQMRPGLLVGAEMREAQKDQEERWEKVLKHLTKDLNNWDSFRTGISLRASKSYGIMALMARIPYFDIHKSMPARQESFSLSEYRCLESGAPRPENVTGDGSSEREVLVHQAWFIVFNHGLTSPLPPPDAVMFQYRGSRH